VDLPISRARLGIGRRRRFARPVGSLLLVGLGLALSASAASGAPVVGEEQAVRAADRDPKVAAQRRIHRDLSSSAEIEDGNWEVSFYAAGDQVALVVVDDVTGLVRESWTGYQVAWKMARGYEGTFGHKLNAPYVFLPLCALFLIGLVDWRRLRRPANLDLLALLAFGVSHFFFNRAEIGLSVPLQYPPLLYLLGRCLWLGLRGRGLGLGPVWPASWPLVAALFLVGFRVGLNIADAAVIDVGYASVVGADRISDGEQLYGGFPDDVSQGDTYGPVNYLAYVPFEQIWPWSGSWDELPAGHGAAVFFDLATFALLLLLGRRLRPGPEGRMMAATLGFAWAAYPYTTFVLQANSNDTLVALLLVLTLVLVARPAARGATLAMATLTKFVPILLAPMLLTYEAGKDGIPRDSARGPIAFALAFLAVAAALMAWPLIDPGLATFYDRTIAYQAGRDSPFSVWGQAPELEPLRIGLLAATGLMALVFALRPRRKSIAQVAALGAAALIAAQLAAQHWFYLYIVWFFPLVLVALVAISPAPASEPARSTPPARWRRRRSRPPSPRRHPPRSRTESASA
jgi:hypothetical protein